MDFKDLLKKIFIGFFKILGVTSRPCVYFTVRILNWNNDCTQEKALEIESFIEIEYLDCMVSWSNKEIYVDLHGPNDLHVKEFLTLEEVRRTQKLILEILKKKGYEAIIFEERLNALYQDKSWYF